MIYLACIKLQEIMLYEKASLKDYSDIPEMRKTIEMENKLMVSRDQR